MFDVWVMLIAGVTVIVYPLIELFAFMALVAAAAENRGPLSRAESVFYTIALVILPTLALLLGSGEVTESLAGFTPAGDALQAGFILIWLASAAVLAWGLWHNELLFSHPVFPGALALMASISAVCTLAVRDEWVLALWPGAAFVNISLFAIRILRGRSLCRNQTHSESTTTSERPARPRRRWNMSVLRFFGIIVIFGAVSVAWLILGGTMWARTESQDSSLSSEMRSLWGPKHIVQPGPFWASHELTNGRRDENCSAPASSVVTAHIRHDHRNKGLLWFSSFEVDFDGTYTVPSIAEGGRGEATFYFDLPHGINRLDNATVTVDGAERPVRQQELARQRISVPVDRAREATVRVRFTTRGQDAWVYSPGAAVTVSEEENGIRMVSSGRWDQTHAASVSSASNPLSELSNFSLTVTTDFEAIDYPKGTCSPDEPAEQTHGGMTASWAFSNSITNQAMGVTMPKRPNAGPIAARMSLFAPVSLFFFFTVLFTVVILRKIPLHPMHYLFIAAGFFAFHILLAYLVDKMPLQAAFWICAAVATALVVSYMRLVAGVKFAVLTVGAAELVYLVGFSYAFFYPGYTGLMIVIVAIITLFVLMQATGRVNWFQAFRAKAAGQAPAAPPVPAPAPNAPAPKADSDGPVQL